RRREQPRPATRSTEAEETATPPRSSPGPTRWSAGRSPSERPWCCLALVVSTSRVAGTPAVFIVRPMTVVRVARIASLGAVADALVALVLVLVALVVIIAVAVAAAARTAGDGGAGDRHVGLRPCIPIERATGQRN